jgi:hypothetical protein
MDTVMSVGSSLAIVVAFGWFVFHIHTHMLVQMHSYPRELHTIHGFERATWIDFECYTWGLLVRTDLRAGISEPLYTTYLIAMWMGAAMHGSYLIMLRVAPEWFQRLGSTHESGRIRFGGRLGVAKWIAVNVDLLAHAIGATATCACLIGTRWSFGVPLVVATCLGGFYLSHMSFSSAFARAK